MLVLSSLVLSSIFMGCTLAAPSSSKPRYTARNAQATTSGAHATPYAPPGRFETYGAGIDHSLSRLSESASMKNISISFISSQLGVSEDEISFRKSFTGDVASHAYLAQKINGIEVANAVANVALNDHGKVLSFGANFIKPESVSSATSRLSSDDAILAAEQSLNATYNKFPTSLKYYATDDGSVVLTHVVQVHNTQDGHWLQAFIDAATGVVVAVNDFTAESGFRVIPIDRQGLDEGQELITDPEDPLASPDGWNTGSTGTLGNNAVAYKGPMTNITQESSPGLIFDYPGDDSLSPIDGANIDAARTNAFYVINSVHDITYRYGFTEAAFNSQDNNFGKGGTGGDRVNISVQAPGTNNANFATFPDGQSGLMQLFIFTLTSPNRDSALQNDIIAHELTHGVTNRLTGGGTASCLNQVEARGLGEGWSDAFADWLSQTPQIRDFTTGSYVTNRATGGRTVPYSTNRTIDPLLYSDLQTRGEVHDIGEVWATILHDVFAALVHKHGFATDAKTNPDGTEGNVIYLHLFIDQLSIQPCEPTFLDARDAWIQADVNRYNGANRCILWNAFAGRGLGVNAANHVDDFTAPRDCSLKEQKGHRVGPIPAAL